MERVVSTDMGGSQSSFFFALKLKRFKTYLSKTLKLLLALLFVIQQVIPYPVVLHANTPPNVFDSSNQNQPAVSLDGSLNAAVDNSSAASTQDSFFSFSSSSPISATELGINEDVIDSETLAYLVLVRQEFEQTVEAIQNEYGELTRMNYLQIQQDLEVRLAEHPSLADAEKDRYRNLQHYYEVMKALGEAVKSGNLDQFRQDYQGAENAINPVTGDWQQAFRDFAAQERLSLPDFNFKEWFSVLMEPLTARQELSTLSSQEGMFVRLLMQSIVGNDPKAYFAPYRDNAVRDIVSVLESMRRVRVQLTMLRMSAETEFPVFDDIHAADNAGDFTAPGLQPIYLMTNWLFFKRVPVIDLATGQPKIDPATGKVVTTYDFTAVDEGVLRAGVRRELNKNEELFYVLDIEAFPMTESALLRLSSTHPSRSYVVDFYVGDVAMSLSLNELLELPADHPLRIDPALFEEARQKIIQEVLRHSRNEYERALKIIHDENPNLMLGYYRILPDPNLVAAYVIRDQNLLNDKSYEDWQADNNIRGSILADDVDILFPHLYNHHVFSSDDQYVLSTAYCKSQNISSGNGIICSDKPEDIDGAATMARWQIYAEENIRESLRLADGKPVIPYLATYHHPNGETNPLGWDAISGDFMKVMLDTVSGFTDELGRRAAGAVIYDDIGTWRVSEGAINQFVEAHKVDGTVIDPDPLPGRGPLITNINQSEVGISDAKISFVVLNLKDKQEIVFEYRLKGTETWLAAIVMGSVQFPFGYEVNLSSLQPDTVHEYWIQVREGDQVQVEATGEFQTQVEPEGEPRVPVIEIVGEIPTVTNQRLLVVSYRVDGGEIRTQEFNLTVEKEYSLSLKDKDAFGNEGEYPFKVTLDITAPIIEVVSHVPLFVNDPSYYIAFRVDGGDMQITSFTLTEGINDHVVISATDEAGNYAEFRPSVALDVSRPTGSISINPNTPYTNSTSIMLSLSAQDEGSAIYDSGIGTMSFSTDGLNWSSPEPFSPSRSFDLPDGDGNKMIYVKYFDRAGNESIVIDPASIILDRIPPEIRIVSELPSFTFTSPFRVIYTVDGEQKEKDFELELGWNNHLQLREEDEAGNERILPIPPILYAEEPAPNPAIPLAPPEPATAKPVIQTQNAYLINSATSSRAFLSDRASSSKADSKEPELLWWKRKDKNEEDKEVEKPMGWNRLKRPSLIFDSGQTVGHRKEMALPLVSTKEVATAEQTNVLFAKTSRLSLLLTAEQSVALADRLHRKRGRKATARTVIV